MNPTSGPEKPTLPQQAPKLLDQVRERIRTKHYSLRTEKAYVDWIRRFILFHGKRHPREMGATQVEAFLFWLSAKRNVAANPRSQALSTLSFRHREVLEIELPWLDEVTRVKKPERPPTVLTAAEVRRVLAVMEGTTALAANIPRSGEPAGASIPPAGP